MKDYKNVIAIYAKSGKQRGLKKEKAERAKSLYPSGFPLLFDKRDTLKEYLFFLIYPVLLFQFGMFILSSAGK